MLKTLLIDLGDSRRENNEPIGMECIASYVESNSEYNVDLQWFNIDDNIHNVLNYDIVGISLNIGNLDIFDRIYRIATKQTIIVGGNIPTFASSELLQHYSGIICSLGEGEETFLRLLEFLESNTISSELINIPNIAFKIDGQIYETIRKPFSLDSAPQIKRDEKIIGTIKKTNGIARIEASRGCSWRHCTFCCVNSKYADPNWRGFSIEKITNELIDLSDMGILSPYFTDEDFYGNQPSRVKALADAITDLKLNSKINYKMDFFLSILTNDIAKSEGKEALKALKKAGLREVFMGIESLGRDQLERFNKKAIPDLNKKAISFVKSLGLQVDLGFILFDPEMSIEELISNVEYIDDLKLNNYDSRSIKRLRLQPRTAYANNYIDSTYILDINNLEYPYVFKDKKVNMVYTMYKKWEDECVAKVWRYQALTRGENVPDRELLKQALGEIRNVDFKALKVILTYIVETISENEYLIQMGEFRDEKQVIMKNFEALLIKCKS